MLRNGKKEETKRDGGWEKADFIKQVDVGHFTAHIQKQKRLTKTQHAHTRTVNSRRLKWWMTESDVKDSEWSNILRCFYIVLLSVSILCEENKTEISYWERHAKMEIANPFTTVHTWVMTHYPLTLTTAIKDPTAVLWFPKVFKILVLYLT